MAIGEGESKLGLSTSSGAISGFNPPTAANGLGIDLCDLPTTASLLILSQCQDAQNNKILTNCCHISTQNESLELYLTACAINQNSPKLPACEIPSYQDSAIKQVGCEPCSKNASLDSTHACEVGDRSQEAVAFNRSAACNTATHVPAYSACEVGDRSQEAVELNTVNICQTPAQVANLIDYTCDKGQEASPIADCRYVPPIPVTQLDPDPPEQPPDPNTNINTDVPVKEFYDVQNNVAVVYDDDDSIIRCDSCSLTLDKESGVWTGNIGVKHVSKLTSADMTRTIKITINGVIWRMLVGSQKTTKEFGKITHSVSLHGHSKVLASPYAQATSHAYDTLTTAQTIIDDILAASGSLWTSDFDLLLQQVDIPANIYGYVEKTPMQVINDICQLLGWIAVPDTALKVLHIKHSYRIRPWFYASTVANVTIPDSVITSLSEKTELNADINAIYVNGAGLLSRVYFTATAGDHLGTTINSVLGNDSVSNRYIGEKALADSVNDNICPIDSFNTFMDNNAMPLLNIGDLVSIQGIKGLVQSISINTDFVSVGQSVSLGADSTNSYTLLNSLTSSAVLVGTLVASYPTTKNSLLTLPSGTNILVRGEGIVNNKYFIKDNAIVGDAPTTPIQDIQVN